jgi:Tol biopolymer transport system component
MFEGVLKKLAMLATVVLLVTAFSLAQPERQITKDSADEYHVKWSTDGKKIAFASQREGKNNDIWVKDVN